MAKIIGRKKIVKKQYKGTCSSCGAIILFEENELESRYHYNVYCFSEGICPSCGNTVKLDKNQDKISDEEASKLCDEVCPHYKNGECTYCGTDWRECPKS